MTRHSHTQSTQMVSSKCTKLTKRIRAMLFTRLITYVLLVTAVSKEADRLELIQMAIQHEKESLRDEDNMMAEHLRREGYLVKPPANM